MSRPVPRGSRRALLLLALTASVYFTLLLFSQKAESYQPSKLLSPSNIKQQLQEAQQQVLGVLSSTSSYRPAPGFEDSLANCRVSDLINDPITQEYGQNNIRLSRTYEGTGARVRRVLRKALNGDPIRIAVVGGSVSSGHGLGHPLTTENYMYKRIHKWFTDTFPDSTVDLNLDSVIPAMTAFYFSYCVKETLPDDIDLVLVELDINSNDPTPGSLDATEALFRTLLALPNQPAVVCLSVFALVFNDLTHGWRHTALITQWLDIPMINIRNFYLPHLMKHPQASELVFTDWAGLLDERHINRVGHKAMADMTNAYFREQLCLLQREGPAEVQASNPLFPSNEIAGSIPRLGMLYRWDEKRAVPNLDPTCRSITSTKNPLKPLAMSGFESVNRNDKRSFEGTKEGDEIAFRIHVVTGQVGFYYWRTKDPRFGSVECWIDDEKNPDQLRYVLSYDPNWQAAVFEHTEDLWTGVTPGYHLLTCRVQPGPEGGTLFRFSSVVTR